MALVPVERRVLVDAIPPLVPRGSLGSRQLLSARHPSRGVHPRVGVGNFREPTFLHATLRVLLQAVDVRTAATLTAR